MKARGITQAALARGMKRGKDYIYDLVKNRKDDIGASDLLALADELDTTCDWIMAGRGEPDGPAGGETRRKRHDLPVFGSAAGSWIRAERLATQPIEHIGRPAALRNVPDAYAIYVTGRSMEPVHCQGDLRAIHPRRPARIGDDVIVHMRDGSAQIGRLAAAPPGKVRLHKFNPASTVDIDSGTVRATHLVLTTTDLLLAT